MPIACYLLTHYGDFVLIDATFKLTIFAGRITIIISVVDAYGHVHPVSVSDMPAHREEDWLKAFDRTYDLVCDSAPAGWKPKTALLMRDREDAIEIAWTKCKWNKVASTARCSKHSVWSVAKQKMQNGSRFGAERAKAWEQCVYKTCLDSFNDHVGYLCKVWKDHGDIHGANHLHQLGLNSDTPLCKWTPVACPFQASGGGESINQMFKATPKTGARRQKLKYLQFVSHTPIPCSVSTSNNYRNDAFTGAQSLQNCVSFLQNFRGGAGTVTKKNV